MATSGTATWNPGILEVIEEAFERIGGESRVGYDITTARRSLNYLFSEWANRGINMWTLEAGTQLLTASTASYTLPADTVDLLDGAIRTNSGNVTSQTDIAISRITFDTYQAIPNKTLTGYPTQYMVHRGTSSPTVYFWAVPDDTQTYYFYYWRLRRIQDAGTAFANTADVPFRFLAAMTSGLAYHLAAKKRAGQPIVQELKARYEEDFELAASEDRDRSSWMIVPFTGYL